MAERHEVRVTLSAEALAFVRAKMADGEYATESDVIEHELAGARLEEEAQRRWEDEVLLPVHDDLMANPESAISLEEVQEHLRSRPESRRKAS